MGQKAGEGGQSWITEGLHVRCVSLDLLPQGHQTLTLNRNARNCGVLDFHVKED